MTVHYILEGKGRDVATASPDTALKEIAAQLAERKIGALVIVDGATVKGIVSERDLVRHIANNGSAALDIAVSQCMTSKVISCEPSETIDQVMGKMTAGRFRHLPVLDEGKLAGIISIGDVVKRKIEQTERDAEELKRYIAG
ncbi:MAG: CBS domain-containing protein [Pseudomonadota bacterium]